MNKDKIEAIKLALEKIAKNTGEDEDAFICDLEDQFDIKITGEEVSSFRESLRAEHIWIWVLKPFNQEDYEVEKKNLYFINGQHPAPNNQFVKKERLVGKDYIKYPKYTLLSRVQDYIFERLLEEFGIKYEHFTESEWEDILASKEFKRAELQAAREIIAFEYHHKILSENT